MRQGSCAALAIALVASTTPGSTQGPATPAPAPARVAAADPAFLTKYCVTCHSDRAKAGGPGEASPIAPSSRESRP